MECSEGERQYGEGSKRELVPQRDRNSVVKENSGGTWVKFQKKIKLGGTGTTGGSVS
jgi:hypothetical protein